MKLNLSVINIIIITLCAGYGISQNKARQREVNTGERAGYVLAGDLDLNLKPESIGDTLHFREALSLALRYNPGLKAAKYKINVKRFAAKQEARLPNPELAFEIENFAGSGAYEKTALSEATFSAGQLIELAGKRKKRLKLADTATEISMLGYREEELSIFTDVVYSYTLVLATQEEIRLATDLLDLAGQFKDTIRKRVNAGRVSPAQLSRAKVEVINARIRLERAHRKLAEERMKLASVWGAETLTASVLAGELKTLEELPAFETLLTQLSENPTIEILKANLKYRKHQVELEKANRIPDPTFSAGIRKLNETNDATFTAGLSFPLPLFNNNSNAIAGAAEAVVQSEWQSNSVRIKLQRELQSAYNTLLMLQMEVDSYHTTLIPEAQNAFRIISDGYEQGKYGVLDVLDAQRVLFEIRSSYLSSLLEYNLTLTRIEGLTGQKIMQYSH